MYLGVDGAGPFQIQDSALVFDSHTLSWIGATPGEWTSPEPGREVHRYCKSNVPQELCTTGVATIKKLLRRNLYPGVDWLLYWNGRDLEYDLVLQPGADLTKVRFRISGVHLNQLGDLEGTGLLHRRPTVYQDGARQTGRIVMKAPSLYGFEVDKHDVSKPLTIDPIIQRGRIDGGQGEDRTIASYGGLRIGTTRSADWTGRANQDIFIRSDLGATFWGGDGDEYLLAHQGRDSGSSLWLAGSTNSTDLQGYFNQLPLPAKLNGGTDGFVLEFTSRGAQNIQNAFVVGGPGDDRINSLTTADALAFPNKLLLGGETNNGNWPSTLFSRIGPGGSVDAFAVTWTLSSSEGKGILIGGSGTDRCTAAIRAGEQFAVAGETDSPDFPAAVLAGGAIDAWAALLTGDLLDVQTSARWGGSADEKVAAAAYVPGEGIYLLGTTTSQDLPKATNSYGGGPTDGFGLKLRLADLALFQSTYLGGDGRDAINYAVATRLGDLYVAGSTDSTKLDMPGSMLAAKGGIDALFLHLDSWLDPLYSARLGGEGSDEFLFVNSTFESTEAELAGITSDPAWLSDIAVASAYAGGEGGGDGFALALSFPTIQVAPYQEDLSLSGKTLVLGNNLVESLAVTVTGDRASDGLLLARPADPSIVAVAATDAPGEGEQTILRGDSVGQFPQLLVSGLSGSGETFVLIQARNDEGYAQRRLHIRLAPSALYVPSVGLPTNGTSVGVPVSIAPIADPDAGTPGRAQQIRRNLQASVSMRFADPTSAFAVPLRILPGSISFPVEVQPLRAGLIRAIPESSMFPTAPGQETLIQSGPAGPQGRSGLVLMKDHYLQLQDAGNDSESYDLEALGPGLLVSTDTVRWNSKLRVTAARGSFVYYLLSTQDQGSTGLRISSVAPAQPLNIVHTVRHTGYRVTFSPEGSVTLLPNVTVLAPTLQLVPTVPGIATALNLLRPDSPYFRPRVRSSNPAVVQIIDGFQQQMRTLKAGDATIEFDVPASEPVLSKYKLLVHVSTPGNGFLNINQIDLALGGTTELSAFAQNQPVPLDSPVRIRSSNPAVVLIRNMTFAAEQTMSLQNLIRGLVLGAAGPLDSTATIELSSPGAATQTISVRIVKPWIRPLPTEALITVVAGKQTSFFSP